MTRQPKPVTLTLAEFDAFQKQTGDDWYFEGDEGYVSDAFWEGVFDPAEVITVQPEHIYLIYQGEEPDKNAECLDFVVEFEKWRTGLDYEIVAVEIPKGKKEELLALVKEHFK
jgi:hypothetical protein